MQNVVSSIFHLFWSVVFQTSGWILPLAILYSYSSVFQADSKADHFRFFCN
jgi:hypothetical protein